MTKNDLAGAGFSVTGVFSSGNGSEETRVVFSNDSNATYGKIDDLVIGNTYVVTEDASPNGYTAVSPLLSAWMSSAPLR